MEGKARIEPALHGPEGQVALAGLFAPRSMNQAPAWPSSIHHVSSSALPYAAQTWADEITGKVSWVADSV